MLKLSPLDWFGKWQGSSASAPSTANADAKEEPYPAKLGKVHSLLPELRMLEFRASNMLNSSKRAHDCR